MGSVEYRLAVLRPSYPLKTARMSLRPYEMDDLTALHDMFGREDICRYLPWEPMDLDQARAKIEQRVGQTHIEADGDPLVVAAVEDASGRVVGEFMLRLASSSSRQGEIGWSLIPEVHGRGLATEALRAMTALAAQHGVAVMVAVTSVDNLASQRVLERAGFTRLLGTIQDDEDGPMLRWELLLRD